MKKLNKKIVVALISLITLNGDGPYLIPRTYPGTSYLR